MTILRRASVAIRKAHTNARPNSQSRASRLSLFAAFRGVAGDGQSCGLLKIEEGARFIYFLKYFINLRSNTSDSNLA